MEEDYKWDTRFGVCTVVKIQVQAFWVLTPCTVAVGYQFFGEAQLE
jgi:hypothetical protein